MTRATELWADRAVRGPSQSRSVPSATLPPWLSVTPSFLLGPSARGAPALVPAPPNPSTRKQPSLTATRYAHWRDVHAEAWRWANFSPAEIACRGAGSIVIDEAALDRLQALRGALDKPLIIRSAYWSLTHNRAVDGVARSQHLLGIAFDISMANHDPEAFEAAARTAGFTGFSFYPRPGFIHFDLGPAREWGERSRPRATPFPVEPPQAREVLAESPTLNGSGAAGVKIAQEALAEAQGAILPLVTYRDSLRWLFIALALGGIALAIHARIDDWRKGRR